MPFHNFGRKRGTDPEAPVHYLDGSVLSRPLDMPIGVRIGLAIALAAAIALGGFVVFKTYDFAIGDPQREQNDLRANIAKEVPLDLPPLLNLLFMDDATAMQTLLDLGFTYYEITPIGQNSVGGFEVLKLPQDISLEEAGILYLQGIDNLSPSSAAKLLNGSWVFTFNREGNTSVRVRYADFRSGSIDQCISSAKEAEGIADAEVSDSGVDDSGNTFQTGNLLIEGTPVTWRVSVVPLSDIYDINGLPDNTYYVGIRYIR